MDLRLVSLLLLVAYACGAWSRTTRNYPRIVPRRQQQKWSMQRRSVHLLQRPVRAISEFLEPPPLPIANHPQFAASPSYRPRKPNRTKHNQAQGSSVLSPAATSSLPPRGKQARNGRYARPQSADPAYLSNLIGWLNPFAPASLDAAAAKEAHPKGSSNFPQYAAHMPYTGGAVPLYGAPGNEPSQTQPPQAAPFSDQFLRTASTWTSGNSCNPCHVFPWTPVIRNDVPSHPGQYAANYGSNSHVAAPSTPARPLDPPAYSYSAASEPAPPNQRDNYPHISSGPTPPLYQAQPFRDGPPKDYYSASSPDQLPPPVFHQASSPSFDQGPHRQQEQQQQQQSSLVHFQPAPATSSQHYNIHVQQSPIIDVEQAAILEEEHPAQPSAGLDYHQAAATVVESIEAQRRPMQSHHVDATVHQQDADQAESRPAFRVAGEAADSKERWRASGASVHFQRSPLVELSVAGESTPAGSNRLPQADAGESSTVPPSASLIDYIVSSRQETRPTASTTGTTDMTDTTTTTASRSTSTDATLVAAADQKQQESRIETLVQSYEFYKKRSNRTKLNETTTTTTNSSDGRVFSSENDDFSASREALAPSNSSDSAKKVIQIIIPYTSQYTPSPFHSTKSVSQRGGDEPHLEQTTTRQLQLQQQDVGDNSIEDSVPIIQEPRRVAAATVTRALEPSLRNNHTGNSIDVHRLQKNIDNWTIQEFSKKASAITNLINATYPRWISSKQIPDEYLLATTAEEDSNEYYDFSREKQLNRGINRIQVTTRTTTTTSTEPTGRVKVVNAIYPKSTKKPEYLAKSPSASGNSGEEEKVYVVTPIPNPNSLEVLSAAKDHEGSRSKVRRGKDKKQDSDGLEQAYQVLPQAVNNLAVLANAPESAAPALWGIMEHEQIAASPNQPRWRSESDVLPEPASTPILYAGHSKVSPSRSRMNMNCQVN